jgi:hypothetical protein
VISALETQLLRSKKSTVEAPEQVRAIEARLRRATGLIEETRSASETEIDAMTKDLPEAFYTISASVLVAWAEKSSSTISADKIINDSLLQFVQRRVKKLQDSLEGLALRLREDLKTSAADLGIADIPSDDEFQSFVRGTPIFDLGSIGSPISRATISLVLGKRFAERRLANRLYRQFGEPMNKALATYSEVLKEWARLVTSQLDRRFETYAERYRAQAERSLGGTRPAADEANAIQESLRVLLAPPCDDFAATTSTRARRSNPGAIPSEIVHHTQKGESR